MANEKKAMKGMTTANEAAVVVEIEAGNAVRLLLTRTSFTSSKTRKKLWSYHLNGKVSRRDVTIDFEAKDNGGYDVLALLFDVAEEAGNPVELISHEERMQSDNGASNTYTVYEAYTKDLDGAELTCPVKFSRGSDKAMFLNMLRQLGEGGVSA